MAAANVSVERSALVPGPGCTHDVMIKPMSWVPYLSSELCYSIASFVNCAGHSYAVCSDIQLDQKLERLVHWCMLHSWYSRYIALMRSNIKAYNDERRGKLFYSSFFSMIPLPFAPFLPFAPSWPFAAFWPFAPELSYSIRPGWKEWEKRWRYEDEENYLDRAELVHQCFCFQLFRLPSYLEENVSIC